MKFYSKLLLQVLFHLVCNAIYAQGYTVGLFKEDNNPLVLNERISAPLVIKISSQNELDLYGLSVLQMSIDSTFDTNIMFETWSGFDFLPPFWDSTSSMSAVFYQLNLGHLLSEASTQHFAQKNMSSSSFDTTNFFNNFSYKDSIWIKNGVRVYIRALGLNSTSNILNFWVEGISKDEEELYLRRNKRILPVGSGPYYSTELEIVLNKYRDWSFLKLARLNQIDHEMNHLEISIANESKFRSYCQDIKNIGDGSQDSAVTFRAKCLLFWAKHIFRRIEEMKQ
jgi:hypothetical protein